MATLILGAVGTLVGGPLGGALGALVGQQVDRAVLGAKSNKGPRLKDLAIQTSSYGAPLPRHYGRMRAAGSVIWATELKEQRDKSGGGKGKPKVVSYSYSSSFAVALASRPIIGVGRIWADGKLLRGAAGDLKVAGTLRVHSGAGDQPADPLIAAAEGASRCPAFRNVAYAVFEDLALAEFGNRIPSLAFEVIADDGAVSFAQVVRDALPDCAVEVSAPTVAGYSIDGGSAATLLEALSAAAPLACTSAGARLTIASAESVDPTTPLPEPLQGDDEGEGPRPSLSRTRARLPAARSVAVRYYDIARDHQAGVQRSRGRHAGEPATLEFAAALAAPDAAALADAVARRSARAAETATCRVAEADPALFPGRAVALWDEAGSWLVETWELGAAGIELALRKLPFAAPSAAGGVDAGRHNPPADLIAAPTRIAAFELPWDGVGTGDSPALFAALASAGAGWSGAALFVERPDASLVPLGSSGRRRATLGTVATLLAPAAPHALDLRSVFEVTLAGPDLALSNATPAQLALGANRALVGNELIQFLRAVALGAGAWRVSGLLRGRGGSEAEIATHGPDEDFVLIDDALVTLDPTLVGDAAHARVAAQGLADPAPILAPIAQAGVTVRPLSPVHGTLRQDAAGGLELRWTRRARGGWLWRDGVDLALGETAESYVVALGPPDAPIAQWTVAEPRLALPAAEVDALRATAPGAPFAVRQVGDRAVSNALLLGVLS